MVHLKNEEVLEQKILHLQKPNPNQSSEACDLFHLKNVKEK